MEKAIREGTLRLLTSEASCDVVLSCRGHKLMAHKVMLSIASPVLQELFSHETAEPTVLILPDVNADIMSLILDYIYTGSVGVYSQTLPEFLSVANFFQLHIDEKFNNYGAANGQPICHNSEFNTSSRLLDNCLNTGDNLVKKVPRKVPNLMPIAAFQNKFSKARKGLYNSVIPSPWCPRIAPLLVDPRKDCMRHTDLAISPIYQPHDATTKEENDTNNNFQPPILPKVPSPFFRETVIKPDFLYTKPPLLIPPPDIPKETDLKTTYFVAQNLLKATTCRLAPAKMTPPLIDVDAEKKEEKKSALPYSSPGSHEIKVGLGVLKAETAEESTVVNKAVVSDEDGGVKDEQKGGEKHKPFKCEDCGKCFSQLRNYKYHRSVHEGTKEFAAKCPECGKVFNDRGYLSSHLKIHRDRKEYACPHCPKRFNQRVAYNMHLRIHTGVKPHECPTCGKSFSRKMLLKQHQRVHTGERPYSCPECGKSFADRSNMSLHARLHTGVKPYACNLCPKSFTKKHHLKTHMNFHTGLKPYTCQKCGLAFSQSSNMRTHYKKCILKSTEPPQEVQST